MTNILLMNIPAGPFPTDYPPIAISRVIEGIDPSLNCDVSFFDLDYYRPTFEEIKSKIQNYSPRIIGFSAILTPSYAYLKKLSIFIKENFPHIVQVLGGEMTVISNIILLKTKIDFCCVGESEPVFSNLAKRLAKDDFKPWDMKNYIDIKGLVFLKDKTPHFTGYQEENAKNGLRQFNYKLMSKITNLNNYIHKVDGQYFKVRVINSDVKDFLSVLYPQNRSKNLTAVFASKGCVNRCTFCHRYFRGYKVIDPDEVISHIGDLKKDCDIGMVLFSEENFGTNIKATSRLVEYLKTTGLNWAATAVRVRTVNEEAIKTWKDAGCVHIICGIESLSQKILNVMEKRTTVEENLNAIRLCHKHKIFTVIALVIGMPGETEETIEETISNLSTVIPDDINMPFEICVNYVQAVPGTPLYEYARRIGFIGQSLEDEESYIESLNSVNANEIGHYLNFTDYEKEEVAYWKYYIFFEVLVSYIRKHGYINVLMRKKTRAYRASLLYILLPKRIRKFLLKHFIIAKIFGVSRLVHVFTKKIFMRKARFFEGIDISLRKINQRLSMTIRKDDVSTSTLRKGW